MSIALLDLQATARELSQEGMRLNFKFENVKKALPEFVRTVTDFIGMRMTRDDNLNVNLINVKKVEELARKTNYKDLRYVKVQVPEGLTLDLVSYLDALDQMQASLDSLDIDLLVPFQRMLASWLANPEELSSKRSQTFLSSLVNRDSDAKAEALSGAFDPRQGDRRNYGDLIRRQSDWRGIAERYNHLVERYGRINRQDIEEHVLAITEYLNVLIDHINNDPEGYALSGISLSDLAKVTFVLAQEVEHYALQGFMLKSLQPTIDAAVEVMKD